MVLLCAQIFSVDFLVQGDLVGFYVSFVLVETVCFYPGVVAAYVNF